VHTLPLRTVERFARVRVGTPLALYGPPPSPDRPDRQVDTHGPAEMGREKATQGKREHKFSRPSLGPTIKKASSWICEYATRNEETYDACLRKSLIENYAHCSKMCSGRQQVIEYSDPCRYGVREFFIDPIYALQV
jgi:hypothetical protein